VSVPTVTTLYLLVYCIHILLHIFLESPQVQELRHGYVEVRAWTWVRVLGGHPGLDLGYSRFGPWLELGLDRDLVLGAYGLTNILIIIIIIIIIKTTKKISMNVFSWEFMGPQLVQLVFLTTQRGGKKRKCLGQCILKPTTYLKNIHINSTTWINLLLATQESFGIILYHFKPPLKNKKNARESVSSYFSKYFWYQH